jgi:hypothetical protein
MVERGVKEVEIADVVGGLCDVQELDRLGHHQDESFPRSA